MNAVGAPILALEDAAKSYGAVHALKHGTLALRAGEVRALVGENGAGKSTLVKLLGGVVRLDGGRMLVDAEPVDFHSPTEARDAGIAVIYQEPTLFPDLSVAENVVMGGHPLGSMRRIDRRAMHNSVQEQLDRLGVRLDAERPVRGLSIADQQIVEIAKALSFEARVLIMDEPTAALSGPEVERLFGVVRALRDRGAAVLFISHRLEEVFALCDTVTVMRDGEVVHDAATADMTPDEVVRRMVGRELSALFPKEDTRRVRRCCGRAAHARGRVHRHQLRGPRGRDRRARGARRRGRSEVARAIFGIDRADAGHVEVDGNRLPKAKPTAAMKAGIGFVPEDRRQQGLVMELSVARNATLTRMGALSRGGIIRGARRARARRRLGDAPAAQVPPPRRPGRLPLGRQPAEGRAREVAGDRAEGPHRRRADARHRRGDEGRGPPPASELAGRGVAVLMISSELPEVLGMADRVLVMHEGRLTGELSRAEADEERVMRAATGQIAA